VTANDGVDLDARVRRLDGRAVRTRGEGAAFVLYWAQMYRRPDDNAALAYAITRANELGLPCVVYEALRPDYPHASDRFHTFVLQGARDMAAGLASRGVLHAFFLPRTAEEARGVLGKLAARAALVVTDEFPTFIVPEQNAAAAKRVTCPYVVVDDCAVVPMTLFPKMEIGARTIRPKLHRALEAWLAPINEPKAKVAAPKHLDLPFEPIDLARADVAALVRACAIDHDVAPVDELPGGARAAEARLERFLRSGLAAYANDRNDPARDGGSLLSPYLHFGMISARRIALAVRAAAKDGAPEESTTAYLEQLLVRRALAFNFARTCAEHRTYEGIPRWAKETLAKHQVDPRDAETSFADLEAARSPDPIWNAAQSELRARGIVHGYARMLWGKLPIAWSSDPARVHAMLVTLNDRYALDGRDPDGYTNISWCFGLHDRPWPERPFFGTVRTMTSRSARKKLDFDAYLDRARAWNAALA
jgi:deoxyribodipyrimidine photo-lyase